MSKSTAILLDEVIGKIDTSVRVEENARNGKKEEHVFLHPKGLQSNLVTIAGNHAKSIYAVQIGTPKFFNEASKTEDAYYEIPLEQTAGLEHISEVLCEGFCKHRVLNKSVETDKVVMRSMMHDFIKRNEKYSTVGLSVKIPSDVQVLEFNPETGKIRPVAGGIEALREPRAVKSKQVISFRWAKHSASPKYGCSRWMVRVIVFEWGSESGKASKTCDVGGGLELEMEEEESKAGGDTEGGAVGAAGAASAVYGESAMDAGEDEEAAGLLGAASKRRRVES